MEESQNYYAHFSALIEEYEDIIKSLTDQLDLYKTEHEHLKQEVNKIVKENSELTKALEELIRKESSETEEKFESKIDDSAINNLKDQLELAVEEKRFVSELWQNSLRNIDQLEEELKLFEGRSHGYISRNEVHSLKRNYENQIKELQKELVTSQNSLQDLLKASRATITAKTVDLQEALIEQKNLFKVVKRLEKELKDLQSQQDGINELRIRLERSLSDKDKQIDVLQKKIQDSKNKVAEACCVVEAALVEKDGALLREKEAKEEAARLSKIIETIVQETEEKIRNEMELANTKYEVKLEKYKLELENRNEIVKNKAQELEMIKKEHKLLEDQISRLQKGNISLDDSNTSKLLLLEKNLESTFQKLLTSERKLVQLTAERDGIKDDLEQMSKHYELDVKSREIEKQMLQQKIKKLQGELEHSNICLVKFSENVQKLNEKLSTMDSDIQKQFILKDKDSQRFLAEKIQELQDMNKDIQDVLKDKLNKQVDLNKRWKSEFREVTEKLEGRLKQLRSEASSLKKINKELSSKLCEVELRASEYKSHLEKLCSEVNIVATTSLTS